MTREESEKYIKSKMCSDCGVHLGGGKCLDNCNVIEAIKALEQEPSKDMEEIEEVINCDANAEIKLKMISNIVHSKPHYFKTSRENKIIDEHYWKGFSNGIRTAEWRATKQEPQTGRWIILKDEYGDVHEAVCSNCDSNGNHKWSYCPNCGTKMIEPNMSENPTGSKDVIWYNRCNYSKIVVEPQERSEE